MALTPLQRYASYGHSFYLALLDDLKRKKKPQSARWNRLRRVEDHVNTCLDMYMDGQKFESEDLKAAGYLFDLMEKETKRFTGSLTGLNGPKRDARGRFVKREAA